MTVEPGQELAPVDQNSPYQLIPIDSLQDAEPAPVDIMSDYWTPQRVGEKKKIIFQKIAMWPVVDQQSGAVIELPCVFFTTFVDGNLRLMRNGSKKLVAAFQGNDVPPGTGWEVTYLGKVKNRTNSFSSDDWGLHPLIHTTKPSATTNEFTD